MPVPLFESHLEWLKTNGYSTLALHEFEAVLAGAVKPKHKSVLITFDDGNFSDFEIALPALQARGLDAVSFVITSRIGKAGYLTWANLRAMQESGRIAIQSHSHSHEKWNLQAENLKSVVEDIALSRVLISQELSVNESELSHLAWPWGRCTPKLEQLAFESGMKYQYLVQRGAVNKPDQTLRLPRWCCDNVDLRQFSRGLHGLSNSLLACLNNHVYGCVRQVKHGMAYR